MLGEVLEVVGVVLDIGTPVGMTMTTLARYDNESEVIITRQAGVHRGKYIVMSSL